MIKFWQFLIYFLVINIVGFLIMILDKKKAKNHDYRISEKFIFTISLIGGAIGVYIGMYKVRHKTKHLKFTVGIPLLFILNILTIYFLVTNNIIIY